MNYLSTPLEYTPSESRINLPLVQSVLAMQQNKYDVAKQKVQQTLDAFGFQKMLRPQDNEYIQAKLNSITNKINSYGDKNLAHSNVSDSITSVNIGKIGISILFINTPDKSVGSFNNIPAPKDGLTVQLS